MDDWVLRHVVSFLDEDAVYRLWVFAEEYCLDRVRDFLTVSSTHAPLAQTPARHLAMACACWTAVLRLTKPPRSQRLSQRMFDLVLQEIQQLVVPLRGHPDRETAMLTAAPPGTVPQFVMYCAAGQGILESVIWLHHVSRYDPSEALRTASRGGHGHVVAWLLDNAATARWINPRCSVRKVFHFRDDAQLGLCAWKVFYGDEQVDEAVFSTMWGFTDIGPSGQTEYRAADLPAVRGDLDGVQRVLAHDVLKGACTSQAIEDVARRGHLDVLKWLYANHPEVFVTADVFHCAAISGQLAIAQWAAEICTKGETMDLTFVCVVRYGHLHVLQWMVDQFPTSAALHLSSSHLAKACKEGHLPMVEWFIQTSGFNVTSHLLSAAAMGGQLEVFRWVFARLASARRDDVSLDRVLLQQAARSGNLELVRWLVEEYSVWSPSALPAAATNPSTDGLEYLYAVALTRGVGLPDPRGRYYPTSIQHGHFEVLTWLLQHGLTTDYLNKKGFDSLENSNKICAQTHAQLGWSEHTLPRDCWARTPSSMARSREMMQVVIDVYDPEFLRKITWLPKWAVQHGTVASLERLAKIEHTRILSPKVFRLLLQTSTDADKVQWFLTKEVSLFTTRVVQWAVRYDKRRLVTWLLDNFVPTLQRQLGADSNLSFRCEQTALRSAQKGGRSEIALLVEAYKAHA